MGKVSQSNLSPGLRDTSGNGGDISPLLLTNVASSPVNRAAKALRLDTFDIFPGAPCTVRKLNAIQSPGARSHDNTS